MHQASARTQLGLPPRRGKRVAKKGGRPDPKISDLQKFPREEGHGLERPGGPIGGGVGFRLPICGGDQKPAVLAAPADRETTGCQKAHRLGL